MKAIIEEHTITSKKFKITTEHITLTVDYDDVNHEEVDAAATQIAHLIATNWDHGWHTQLYIYHLKMKWERDEGLRDDYDNDREAFIDDMM